MIVHPGKSLQSFRKHFALCGALMVGIICYFGYNVTSAYPQFSDLDKQIIKEYKDLGFTDYANHIESCLKKAYEE